MEKSIGKYTKFGCAVVIGTLISHDWVAALAGWTGFSNAATGIGYAIVNVSSVNTGTTLIAKTNNPANTLSPSASCPPTNLYTKATIALPLGASLTTTFAKASAAPGIILKGSYRNAPGDGADHPEFEERLGSSFVPGTCAALNMETSNEYDPVTGAGTMIVKTTATEGAALWLRGFQYDGPAGDLPVDDLSTVKNETIEFLKVHGVWKFETILLGPYDLSGENGTCPLLIPYNVKELSTLYVMADGLGKSDPLTIDPLPSVEFTCSGPAGYPPAQTSGGCGIVTVSYSPPVSSLTSTPTTVTATATDQLGNTATQTFSARRTQTLAFEGFYSPIGTEGTDCNKVFKNSELTRLGQVIPIKFKTFCNGVIYSAASPTYAIERCIDHKIVKEGTFTFVANEWHGQFDTGEQGITTGVYVIHVILQDGTTRQIAVKLK